MGRFCPLRHAFNDFAEAVEAMPSREKQIPKLKALLEHFEVTDLATAAGLAEHIGDYILTPEISSPQEAAIDELNFTIFHHLWAFDRAETSSTAPTPAAACLA